MWCIGEINEEYKKRMNKILELYQKPYNAFEPMVVLDEKPIQLLGDKRQPIPMRPGKIRRYDSQYERLGTANIFVGGEPKKGKYFARVTKNRKSPNFAKMMAEVEKKYPVAKKINLVLDNLNTHSQKAITDYYGKKEGERIWGRFKEYLPLEVW